MVGCGRSGTTLLYELVCAHPDLAWFSNLTQRWPNLPHLAFFSRMYPLTTRLGLSLRGLPRPAEGHAIFDRCRGGSDTRPLTDDDLSPEQAQCLRGMVLRHLRYQGGRRFLNKNTRNTRRISYLDGVFDDALFIHVVREPAATVSSLLRVAFWPDLPIWWRGDQTPRRLTEAGEDPVRLAAEFWHREVGEVLAGAAKMDEGRYREIRYEDLTEEPLATLESLLEFVDLPRAGLIPQIGELRLRSRNQAARSIFTEGQMATIYEIAGGLASRWGYAPAL